MDFHIKKKNAYLMVELLISLAITLILLQVLVPTLVSSRNQAITKEHFLGRIELKEAVVDHFQSQLGSLLWRSCYTSSTYGQANTGNLPNEETSSPLANIMLQIGHSSAELPARIANKALLNSTDWLMAIERGACRYSTRLPSLTFSIPYSCSWDENDDIVFESCGYFAEGLLTNTTTSKSEFRFSDASIVGKSGTLIGHKAYIWYLAEGKSEQHKGAFWRTPQQTGNSLELWSGIEKLAIYPLLDTNEDGVFDQVAVDYQQYPLAQIKGFWLEMIVNDSRCNTTQVEKPANYKNHRGDIWSYQASCAFALQFVVEA